MERSVIESQEIGGGVLMKSSEPPGVLGGHQGLSGYNTAVGDRLLGSPKVLWLPLRVKMCPNP